MLQPFWHKLDIRLSGHVGHQAFWTLRATCWTSSPDDLMSHAVGESIITYLCVYIHIYIYIYIYTLERLQARDLSLGRGHPYLLTTVYEVRNPFNPGELHPVVKGFEHLPFQPFENIYLYTYIHLYTYIYIYAGVSNPPPPWRRSRPSLGRPT